MLLPHPADMQRRHGFRHKKEADTNGARLKLQLFRQTA
jgi:hypothetical protein